MAGGPGQPRRDERSDGHGGGGGGGGGGEEEEEAAERSGKTLAFSRGFASGERRFSKINSSSTSSSSPSS